MNRKVSFNWFFDGCGAKYVGILHNFGISGGESSAIIEITDVNTDGLQSKYAPYKGWKADEAKFYEEDLKFNKEQAEKQKKTLQNIPLKELSLTFLD